MTDPHLRAMVEDDIVRACHACTVAARLQQAGKASPIFELGCKACEERALASMATAAGDEPDDRALYDALATNSNAAG